MNGRTNTELPHTALANHFSVSRKAVVKHHNNKVPFKKMQPLKKKTGKNSFICKHKKLCQMVVKFWLDHSTPSPNKNDVINGNTQINQASTFNPTMKTTQLTQLQFSTQPQNA